MHVRVCSYYGFRRRIMKGKMSGARYRYTCSICREDFVQDVPEVNSPAICHACFTGNRRRMFSRSCGRRVSHTSHSGERQEK
jgi:hypothetical protein